MGKKSKASSTSTSKTEFAPTTQNNPYFQTSTDSKGNTITNFKPGTAGQSVYDFTNANISGLLNNYLNPTLNNPTTQAKLDLFNKQQQQNLNNNIINPLAQSNMIRSSQADNMYRDLNNQAADYSKELIANSQNDTWNMIKNLVDLYTTGYTGASNEVQQSINSSLGAGTTTSSSSQKS